MTVSGDSLGTFFSTHQSALLAKRTWVRIIANGMAIVWVLLLLLTAELTLRAYHQHRMRKTLPLELRAETRALTWDDIKDKYRIVCFGDSITFGEDLPYAQTYPAMLARLLEQKSADPDVVVINSGIRGHTSVQGLARLERDVLWYKPHVVLIAFGINDGKLGYWPLDPIRERAMSGHSLRTQAAELLHHSHLCRTLCARTRRMLRRLGWQEPAVETRTEHGPQPRVSRQGFEIAQRRLASRIRSSDHATLLLMTTTPVTEAFTDGQGPAQYRRQLAVYGEYNQVVKDVAAQHGACVIDLYNAFTGRPQSELASLLAEDGVHLTAEGEHLVATNVWQALQGTAPTVRPA
ncbi:MAG TPA: SGNH/GDSL hydrolase family protein [Anaerolineae bacterium]|nr:SGNH/GDSL hydrolase family protein [Anaerolineae bacterium]